MKKKLTAAEKMMIQLFGENSDYSFHRCKEHGVHAHRKEIDYEGCSYCKIKYPEVTTEELLNSK